MSRKKLQFFVCEFLEESNSFNPRLADFDDFSESGIYEGDALVAAGQKAGATVGGMLDTVKKRGYTALGGVRMRAKSGGPADSRVVDWFWQKTKTALQALPEKPDGILVSLHGATVSDRSEDVCGDLLESIRALVGQQVVIAAAFDLHANITDKIMRNADIICGYQTYPHIDHYETGCRTANLAVDRAENRPLKTACVTVGMMAPAHGYTTGRGPLKALMEKGHALVSQHKIADFSVFQVQPWLDVKEIASAVVVTAEEESVAAQAAEMLADELFSIRESLLGEKLQTVAEVAALAAENKSDKPVVLVDSADSPNAGATGDCAAVIEQLLPWRDKLKIAVSVNDAPAVRQAFEMGVGATGDFRLGGSLAPELSKPVTVTDCTVKSLHLGEIYLEGPAERHQYRNLGRCAVITAGQMHILITERGQNNGDRQFYRGFGIEPTLCDLVCVKACTSFRAGYEPISAAICNTETPGAAGVVLTELPFHKLPPLFPFHPIERKDISEVKCYR